MVAVSLKLPAVLIEAIDELQRVGPYTSRAAVIRSILTQEVPKHLARYQADEQELPIPTHDASGKRKNISIFMPKRMFANIERMAKELGINRSELIRVAIDHFYREYEVYRK
jgi:metal-responsive CopG/Arc/MetJ family transcriptional regulator